MTDKTIYLNNPLHGLSLETLLNQLIDHYGWEILAEYTNINCFKKNPSLASSIKFFKKTDWAREKIERFYLYEFKHLPKAGADQFDIPPRDRIIPEHHKPREPKVLIPGQAPIPAPESKSRGGEYNARKPQNHSPKPRDKQVSKKNAESKEQATKPSTISNDPWANSPR